METKENNLKVYLKEQMEEYHQECESVKTLYADLLEHIEDCKDQIRRQKEREDPGFALLSPIAGQAGKKEDISAHLAEQIEAYERQKGKYQQQIRFYEEKIAEMQAQLEEFEHNEQLKAEWEKKMQAEQNALSERASAGTGNEPSENVDVEDNGQKSQDRDVRAAGDEQEVDEEACDGNETGDGQEAYHVQGVCDSQEPAPSEEVSAAAVPEAVDQIVSRDKEKVRDVCSYMIRKLTEMKGYVQMDPMRCRMELDRLLRYVQRLEEEAGAAGEQS